MHKPQSEKSDHAARGFTGADIVEIVIRYKAKGSGDDMRIRIDPKTTNIDGLIWNGTRLNALVAKTGEERRKHQGELPDPEPDTKKLDREHNENKDVPEATCCYINGRWICWD